MGIAWHVVVSEAHFHPPNESPQQSKTIHLRTPFPLAIP